MLRYLRYAFLAVLGIVLLIVAYANRAPVTVQLLPEDMAGLLGGNRSLQVPLFIAIFGGILAGLAIGFVWEWFREAKHRSAAGQHRREVSRLEREVSRLRDERKEPSDEILALLDGKGGS